MLRYRTRDHELQLVKNDGALYTLTLSQKNGDTGNYINVVNLSLPYQEMIQVLASFRSFIEHGA